MLPLAQKYGHVSRLPNPGRELVLKAGMTFAFEPNCAFGHHLCNLGGAVIVGEKQGIELVRLFFS